MREGTSIYIIDDKDVPKNEFLRKESMTAVYLQEEVHHLI
jgi:hypothetical protein